MARLFLSYSALLLGSLAAFFLFVPPLLIALMTLLAAGLVFISFLGVHVELHPVRPSASILRKD